MFDEDFETTAEVTYSLSDEATVLSQQIKIVFQAASIEDNASNNLSEEEKTNEQLPAFTESVKDEYSRQVTSENGVLSVKPLLFGQAVDPLGGIIQYQFKCQNCGDQAWIEFDHA